MAARRPRAGRWTRRQFLETTGGVALIGFLAEACGPAAPPSLSRRRTDRRARHGWIDHGASHHRTRRQPPPRPAAAATTAPAAAARPRRPPRRPARWTGDHLLRRTRHAADERVAGPRVRLHPQLYRQRPGSAQVSRYDRGRRPGEQIRRVAGWQDRDVRVASRREMAGRAGIQLG